MAEADHLGPAQPAWAGPVGRTYLERGEPVAVLIRWATMPPAAAAVIWHRPPRRNAPRNVLIERVGGRRVVRPFRGLRRCPDSPP